MMGIITPAGASTSTSTGSSTSTNSATTLDKDDFLKMLITKLTNQDPLNPMDDEAFTAELAQFSSLEQLQNMNQALENSLQWDYMQMQTINNTMATSLIGKDVKATFSGVYLSDDNSPQIQFTTDQPASSIKIEITNSDGTLVRTITEKNVPAGSNVINWDGKSENGERLANGYYNVSITGIDAAGKSFDPSTFITGRVNGVIYREGAAFLQVNGMEIPLSNVSVISESDA
jgi:flagellar basal-body rod modification protein FlgD